MGKNKKGSIKQKINDSVEKKGGSAVSKIKELSKNTRKPENPKQNKNSVKDKSKIIDENKIQNVSLNFAKKNKKKGKQNGAVINQKNSPGTMKENEIQREENGDKNEEKILKLTKREKNRVKSKMSKDVAMDGKSKLGLADPKLVAKQLHKLKSFAEPLSKAKQRKMLLLQKLHDKLQKDGLKTPNSSMTSEAGEEKPPKKEKSEARKEKEKLFLFVGNLPNDITEEKVRKLFNPLELEKVKLPIPRRRKTKRFAYIKLKDEGAKKKALDFHGTTFQDKQIRVLLSDKSKGKSGLMSANAKLHASRKVTPPPANGNSDHTQSPKKNKKKQKNKTKQTSN